MRVANLTYIMAKTRPLVANVLIPTFRITLAGKTLKEDTVDTVLRHPMKMPTHRSELPERHRHLQRTCERSSDDGTRTIVPARQIACAGLVPDRAHPRHMRISLACEQQDEIRGRGMW
jgi:hypothetical protein